MMKPRQDWRPNWKVLVKMCEIIYSCFFIIGYVVTFQKRGQEKYNGLIEVKPLQIYEV